jgi:dephospho-CoA kinase
MIIIGLTGSIGMGKSYTARQFQYLGVPVHDADGQVHALLQPNGLAFAKVQKAFPQSVKDGVIDRKTLGQCVFNDPEKRKILEDILHPLVRQTADQFIKQCRRKKHKICVLDIPLLFETGRDRDVHVTVTATAPRWVQKRRVLSRPNMTLTKFKSIENLQIPDYRKRALSDMVLQTGRGPHYSFHAIKRIIKNAFELERQKGNLGDPTYRV